MTQEDDAAAEHSTLARAHLMSQVNAAGGWLSFERFMDLALYAPAFGYYSGGAEKLGADGDFTTAPEISRLFGACVAVQCAEILSELHSGCLLEIGAGSGRLAADILVRLETEGRLPERYSILEISADLRERQRAYLEQRLPHLIERVHWLDRPPEHPFEGVILANEVLDALPVARFRWNNGLVDEMGVAISGEEFIWAARSATAAMTRISNELSTRGDRWDEGYTSEYCPRMSAWVKSVTQPLARGAVLWFDYGLPRAQYYLPERRDGTLVCHYRHRMSSDPFVHIGLQDITAWVDFTRVAEASRDAGLELAGFTTQAHFLAGLEIDREMRLAAAADQSLFARLANQARQLLLPGEMGERFKVMACLRALDMPLSGFKLLDLRHTL
ncbi:MAG TPA: SAM-dependent methyltransferase [Steroidobacteraceae bacterium]|jgi:SAM-dependent MidA family methyltransferase|nr:SAM-dependent methyltransferase [Steroidobacteraceae bacterium]